MEPENDGGLKNKRYPTTTKTITGKGDRGHYNGKSFKLTMHL